jgi:4-hydroxy-tetrahydrodipicolinate synthase
VKSQRYTNGHGSKRIKPEAPGWYDENVPNRSLHGIVPALVTPFRADERIDYGAWQALIDAHLAAGVDGLFVGGSSGEFYALDTQERTVMLRFCRQAAAGRVPVYGNVGATTTQQTIRLGQAAQADGVDVLVVVTPYYSHPTQEELEEHYVAVCRAVRAPVLAYNFPHHGGVELLPETFGRIAARCENLVGIKDSSGKLEQTVAYKAAPPSAGGQAGRPTPLAVFMGNEPLILEALRRECAGTVSAYANVAPRLFTDLYRAFREGRNEEAERLQGLVTALAGTVSLHTFPSVIKEAMRLAGRPTGLCRRPIGPVPPAASKRIEAAVAALKQEGYTDEPAGGRAEPVSAPARA